MEKVKVELTHDELNVLMEGLGLSLSCPGTMSPQDRLAEIHLVKLYRRLRNKWEGDRKLKHKVSLKHEEALSLLIAFGVNPGTGRWTSLIFDINRRIHQHYA